MKAIEMETRIDDNGHISLPLEFQYAYGKLARLIVLLPEQDDAVKKKSTTRKRQRDTQGSV